MLDGPTQPLLTLGSAGGSPSAAARAGAGVAASMDMLSAAVALAERDHRRAIGAFRPSRQPTDPLAMPTCAARPKFNGGRDFRGRAGLP
ncbi:hypothetical protein Acsp02_04120 [Actinoplanes sp. NBRC 103695]|nr:hypothetical protein Acsp02_04120 [Actinoplanes sp. NBRC 103695]